MTETQMTDRELIREFKRVLDITIFAVAYELERRREEKLE